MVLSTRRPESFPAGKGRTPMLQTIESHILMYNEFKCIFKYQDAQKYDIWNSICVIKKWGIVGHPTIVETYTTFSRSLYSERKCQKICRHSLAMLFHWGEPPFHQPYALMVNIRRGVGIRRPSLTLAPMLMYILYKYMYLWTCLRTSKCRCPRQRGLQCLTASHHSSYCDDEIKHLPFFSFPFLRR